MRKTVLGRVYDTTAAKQLGTYRAGLDMHDPRWMEQSLYQCTDGAYFMVGRGGLQTPYCHTRGISTLNPISQFLAKVWKRRVGAPK